MPITRPIINSDTKTIFKTSTHIKELMDLERSGLTERWLARGKMSKIYYEHVFKNLYNQSIKRMLVWRKREGKDTHNWNWEVAPSLKVAVCLQFGFRNAGFFPLSNCHCREWVSVPVKNSMPACHGWELRACSEKKYGACIMTSFPIPLESTKTLASS